MCNEDLNLLAKNPKLSTFQLCQLSIVNCQRNKAVDTTDVTIVWSPLLSF